MTLTHLDANGRAVMVDVGSKPVSQRRAVAAGRVIMSTAALAEVRELHTNIRAVLTGEKQ